jgi:hypothetical protein
MKMILASAVLSLAILLIACGKDKFQTKPLIEIDNYNSKEITQGEKLEIRIKYFDKEGDLDDGQLTYIRVRTNGTPIPNPGANDKVDTITTALPSFPPKNTGEINLRVDYGFMDEDPGRNDTMFFRIMVIDKEGNKSDTINTQQVVARQI